MAIMDRSLLQGSTAMILALAIVLQLLVVSDAKVGIML